MTDFELIELEEEHIPELTEVMTRAFDHDSQIHLNEKKGGPEGYDDGTFLKQWGFHEFSDAYTVKTEEKLIGAIIVFIYPHNYNTLGNIFIDPEYQDQGIGYEVFKRIEEMYPETRSWKLGTPSWATRNHHFYRKCGFKKTEEKETKEHVGKSYVFEKKY